MRTPLFYFALTSQSSRAPRLARVGVLFCLALLAAPLHADVVTAGNYIQNRSTRQVGAKLNISSGTIADLYSTTIHSTYLYAQQYMLTNGAGSLQNVNGDIGITSPAADIYLIPNASGGSVRVNGNLVVTGTCTGCGGGGGGLADGFSISSATISTFTTTAMDINYVGVGNYDLIRFYSNTNGSFMFGPNPKTRGSVTGNYNLGIGPYPFRPGVTGSSNISIGNNAINGNGPLSGSLNVAIGSPAMLAITAGFDNTAVGYNAMVTMSTGSFNTAIGAQALYQNTTYYGNTAVGYQAAQGVNSSSNTAVGTRALALGGTVGGIGGETAFGAYALENETGNPTGGNTAIGLRAMQSSTTGYVNTAVGTDALRSHTYPIGMTAIGLGALGLTTAGGSNTAIGYASSWFLSTGSYNVTVGANTGPVGNGTVQVDRLTAVGTNASAGSSTTAVGYSAGYGTQWDDGAGNVWIGYQTGPSRSGLQNAIAIGYGAIASSSNTAVIGGAPGSANSINLIVSTITVSAIVVTGSGAGGMDATEGTAPSGIAGHDLIYADSTDHWLKMINNNGSAYKLAGYSGSPTTGNLATWAAGGVLQDGGAVPSGGGSVSTTSVTTQQFISSGTLPNIANCGTNPQIRGADSAFTFVVGASTNSCAVGFNPVFASTPTCVWSQNVSTSAAMTTTITASTITFAQAQSALSGSTMTVLCMGTMPTVASGGGAGTTYTYFQENHGTAYTYTKALAFGTNITAHSTLLVGCIMTAMTDTMTVGDNNGNSYTRITGATYVSNGNSRMGYWYTLNANAGATTVTCADSGTAATAVQMEIVEYKTASGGTYDTGSEAAGTGATASCGSLTTTVSTEFVGAFAALGTDGATGSGTVRYHGADNWYHSVEDATNATPGSYGSTFTQTSGYYTCIQGAFK